VAIGGITFTNEFSVVQNARDAATFTVDATLLSTEIPSDQTSITVAIASPIVFRRLATSWLIRKLI
jgi:hypothetical protein